MAGGGARTVDCAVHPSIRQKDELREYMRTEGSILKEIRETGDLPDELGERLTKEIEKFKETFAVAHEDPEPAAA